MGVFDEDAEPFDLRDEDVDDTEDDFDGDGDDDDDDDELEDASEDEIDLVIAAYREDGEPHAVAFDFDLANDLEELIRQLGRIPGDHGAFGFVSIDGDIFVMVHVRGQDVKVLLSDVTAATDWPIARDVVDFLGEDMPDEDDDDSTPVGDMDMLEIFGIDSFELEAIASDYDTDSDEQVATIADKLKIGREFEAAVATFDG